MFPLVSIPFIAGQWSLPRAEAERRAARRSVSIPFIAGQWSLPALALVAGSALASFQSPSLRGSGRFLRQGMGNVFYIHVSIPFIAGQWSLLVSHFHI